MASRTSNFCIDAHDPPAQACWWGQVLTYVTLPSAEEQEVLADPEGNEFCGRTPARAGA